MASARAPPSRLCAALLSLLLCRSPVLAGLPPLSAASAGALRRALQVQGAAAAEEPVPEHVLLADRTERVPPPAYARFVLQLLDGDHSACVDYKPGNIYVRRASQGGQGTARQRASDAGALRLSARPVLLLLF